VRRPDTSTVHVSGPKYRGATPWRTLQVSTAILQTTVFVRELTVNAESVAPIPGDCLVGAS